MSADEAVTALPQVMGGTAGPSASGQSTAIPPIASNPLADPFTLPFIGVGSNNNTSSKTIPKAMFVGGGFWEEELERMRQVPEGHSIPWIASDPNAPDMVKVHGLAAVLPMIVERAKGKFRDIGVDDSGSEGSDSGSEGSEGAKPGLYRY